MTKLRSAITRCLAVGLLFVTLNLSGDAPNPNGSPRVWFTDALAKCALTTSLAPDTWQ